MNTRNMILGVLCGVMLPGLIHGAEPRRDVLPLPDPPFKGEIGRTVADSKPDYPQPVRAPQGAPNVLVILLDDVGFGMTSSFGGPVPTPTLEQARTTRFVL